MKEFELDGPLSLPKRVSRRKVGDYAMYIAPENPTWVALPPSEADIFEELLAGSTIAEAERSVAVKRGVPEADVRNDTVGLLEEIETNGFYGLESRTLGTEPLAVHWYFTNGCNLRCINCYMDAGKKLDGELSTEEAKRFVDDVTSLKKTSFAFSGGEPMSRPDFFEVAEYAKRRGHRLALLTNGTLIGDRETAQKIEGLFDFVQISIDGANAGTNDAIRGDGTFELAKGAINYFKGSPVKVNVSVTVSDKNCEDVRDNMAAFARSLENRNISFSIGKLLYTGRGKQQSCGENAEGCVDVALRNLWSDGWGRKKPRRNTKILNCGYANCLILGADGDVHGCPMPYKELVIANVRRDSVASVVEKLGYEAKKTSVENMSCHGACDLEYLCAGDCRIRNYQAHGDITKPACTESKKEKYYNAMLKQNLALREARSKKR